jgi:hypothetical protein
LIASAEAHSPNQCGSINGVGSDLQPLRINDLEMVDLTGASWNQLIGWLRNIQALQRDVELPSRVENSYSGSIMPNAGRPPSATRKP